MGGAWGAQAPPFWQLVLYFPNLYILLKLVETLPITLCECERSFPTLRRLRTWLWASMGTGPLGALASSPYDDKVDYDELSATSFSSFSNGKWR